MNIYNKFSLAFFLLLLVDLTLCDIQHGNFTQIELNTIKNVIGAAQDAYGTSDLNGVAQFISEYLDKAYKKCWNVYVFDKNTKNATFQARSKDQKWLKIISQGKNQLTYLITKDSSIFPPEPVTLQKSSKINFGVDINTSQKDYILTVINETVIYYGQDLDANVRQIRSNLSPGNWNVYISDGSQNFGGYQCRRDENWGRIEKFGRFQWDYYLVRTY